jgi:transposase, IS5 family
MKLNTRCGSAAVQGLNEALLAKAAEAKVLRTNRVHADTTVVPANECYPTDSGLLAKAIRRIGTTGSRIHNAGEAVRTRLRDRSRAAGKRAHGIAAKLRSRSQLGRDEVKDGVQRITGELAELARAAARDAQRVLVNARRALRRAQAKAARLVEAGVHDPVAGRRRGRLARAINDLSTLLQATAKITEQARQRIAGPSPTEPQPGGQPARPRCAPDRQGQAGETRRVRLQGQVVDNDDGIVVDHRMRAGNPRRCTTIGPGDPPNQSPDRPGTTDRDR